MLIVVAGLRVPDSDVEIVEDRVIDFLDSRWIEHAA
jgi:hypothetical protein